MWKCVFQELRGLTNTKINPMELNDLYDHLWNVGVLLQSDDPLSILDDEFRPWPRARGNEAPSRLFYDNLERHKMTDLAELRQFQTRADLEVYRPILIVVMNSFGVAITNYGQLLKSTDGIYRNELRDDRQLEKVSALLCTNNPAERPFAVAKAYIKIYQTLSLRTLAVFSLSMCNSSHRPAESKDKLD
jgi:hypothetical protein